MQTNCPACGAPITDDARFCSHCGAKLPDNTQRIEIKSEIKIEDTAKLEEVRLKYELEEKKRQEKSESKRSGSRFLKVKLWISWIVCVASLCVGMMLYDPIPIKNNPLSTPFMILFTASGIYALVLTFSSLAKKFKREK